MVHGGTHILKQFTKTIVYCCQKIQASMYVDQAVCHRLFVSLHLHAVSLLVAGC